MDERTATQHVTARDGTRIAWHLHLDPSHPSRPDVGRPTLVLTNGLGTTSGFWRHLVEGFADTHRVVHWNYRGHGDSEPASRGDYAIRTQADDLIRVTEAAMARSGTGTPPIHVGFSMGVSVLFELYRARPDLVGGLVLIGGAPDAPYTHLFPMRIPGVLPALRSALRTMTPVVALARPAWRALYHSRLAYPAARALRLVMKNAPRDEIEAFAHELGAMDPKVFWQTLVGLMGARGSDVMVRVSVPTLIVAAEHDTLMPMKQVSRMRDAMGSARFVRVAGAGHAVLVEAGGEVVSALRSFLRDVERPYTAPASTVP